MISFVEYRVNVACMRSIFRFPNAVNENSARLVACGVVAQGLLFLWLESGLLLIPLAYGFAARVVSGPSLSPLGQFVTRVATPIVEAITGHTGRQVPGAPKQFAQMIGLTFTAAAAVAWLTGASVVSLALIAGLVLAAGLEAGAGVCLGCIVYDAIWGCPECADISSRRSPDTTDAPPRSKPVNV